MNKKILKIKKVKIKKTDSDLFQSIALLIQDSKQRVAVAVNSELTLLYWNIGKTIRKEVLNEKRAEYGKEIVRKLSLQLIDTFGNGWDKKHLNHCLRSAETFSEKEILYAVRRQLSWTHIRTIMYIEDCIQREFYIEICIQERWSTRLLQERIGSMLFERTAISKKPEETIKQELKLLKDKQKHTPDIVFRDPYFLDFLGLKDTYSEKDLESAIIAELQRFIIEMGSDFAFMARQKRITIDNEDYYIDLLFYHRKLKCLIVIDLKLDKFKAAYKGQMDLYLRWLEKYESVEGENSPIGLILCSDANKEHIELLKLKESNIKVASYYTALPPLELLQKKFQQAIKIARERIENQDE